MATSIATFSFKSALHWESSMPRGSIPGRHACTMEFFEGEDAGSACIEWDIPSMGMTEEIGLTFQMLAGKRTLIDYDGVMVIPAQAVHILGQLGIVVPRDEGYDEEIDDAAALKGEEIPARGVPMFKVGPAHCAITYTLPAMLEANKDDEALCDWLRTAAIGDVCPDGETSRRVA